MKINEIAMRHKWNDNLGKEMRDTINSSFNGNSKSLDILKSIEKEYYDNDDIVNRDQIALRRIKNELPVELATYLLKYK